MVLQHNNQILNQHITTPDCIISLHGLAFVPLPGTWSMLNHNRIKANSKCRPDGNRQGLDHPKI